MSHEQNSDGEKTSEQNERGENTRSPVLASLGPSLALLARELFVVFTRTLARQARELFPHSFFARSFVLASLGPVRAYYLPTYVRTRLAALLVVASVSCCVLDLNHLRHWTETDYRGVGQAQTARSI
jgi:hypothetical protein